MSANVGENASPFVDQLADGPGVSRIDPTDPAAPMYRLLALMRSPVALRDLMLQPVRTGYIGQEKPIDLAELPKSAADLYPDIRVSELDVPSPLGRIRCQVFSPPGAAARRAMMLYAHGGGFTLGQSEDTAYITSRIAAENAFAEKLRAAGGTEVEHLVRDGMPHGFYFFPGMFKQGDQAFAAIAAFLKRTGLA
jgi:acetyl esterase